MNIGYNPEMTYENMLEVLKAEFPECKASIKKNPILRFEYIELEKSSFVGSWIRIREKKEKVTLDGAIPSALVRGLFGGLLLILFLAKSHKAFNTEVASILKDEYKVA